MQVAIIRKFDTGDSVFAWRILGGRVTVTGRLQVGEVTPLGGVKQ